VTTAVVLSAGDVAESIRWWIILLAVLAGIILLLLLVLLMWKVRFLSFTYVVYLRFFASPSFAL